jgi:hypothetical protein
MTRGQPTKYSRAKQEAICRLLKSGCTRMAAAEASGIAYETFRRWMADNVDFYGAVTRAEYEAEAMFTAVIAKHAVGAGKIESDWRAAESWLKRRRRAEWGDNVSVRADREAARLLSELFPDDAREYLAETPAGTE